MHFEWAIYADSFRTAAGDYGSVAIAAATATAAATAAVGRRRQRRRRRSLRRSNLVVCNSKFCSSVPHILQTPQRRNTATPMPNTVTTATRDSTPRLDS